MKIVKREDFLTILDLIRHGAGEAGWGGEKLIVFDKGWMRGINDNLSVSYKLNTGIKGAVPVVPLYNALKILKTNVVAVSSDADQVQFQCGYTTLKIVKVTGEEHTKIKKKLASINLDKMEWTPIPTLLLEGLNLSLCAAEDSEIGKLTGIVINGSEILSTDNYRIAKYDMGETMSEDFIRLKTGAVSKLLNMNIDFKSVCPSERWLHFKKGNLIVSARLIPRADYPLEALLNVYSKFQESDPVYELPAHLERYIDRAAMLAGIGQGELNFSHQISLKAEGGHLIITGQNSHGSLTTSIPWDGVLPNLTVAPQFLKQVIKLTRKFRVSELKNMVLFEPGDFKILTIAEAEQEEVIT